MTVGRLVTVIAESAIRQMDRDMCDDIRHTGRHLRDAYSEMMVAISKTVHSSATQEQLVKVLPTYPEVRMCS